MHQAFCGWHTAVALQQEVNNPRALSQQRLDELLGLASNLVRPESYFHGFSQHHWQMLQNNRAWQIPQDCPCIICLSKRHQENMPGQE